MTDLVHGNSTQFFDFPLKSEPTINHKGDYDRFGAN